MGKQLSFSRSLSLFRPVRCSNRVRVWCVCVCAHYLLVTTRRTHRPLSVPDGGQLSPHGHRSCENQFGAWTTTWLAPAAAAADCTDVQRIRIFHRRHRHHHPQTLALSMALQVDHQGLFPEPPFCSHELPPTTVMFPTSVLKESIIVRQSGWVLVASQYWMHEHSNSCDFYFSWHGLCSLKRVATKSTCFRKHYLSSAKKYVQACILE